ncbi:MAG: hypothetical protein J0L80_11300 [Chitinophagales bacterium]|nr:hypothetical protein [Chitinophagales bacterium]
MIKRFTLALLCMANLAFAQSAERLAAYKGNNVTLSYPSSWKVDETGTYGPKLFLFSPLKEGDAFSENVNLVLEGLKDSGISLDKYYELAKEAIKKLMTNYKQISSRKLKDANGDYYQFEYTSDQGDYHLYIIQRVWLVNNVAYILTSAAEQTQIEQYRNTFTEIAKTFRIKK